MPKLPITPLQWAQLAARVIVGGILLWAAVPKITDPTSFAESILNYHLVPEIVARVSAAMLPMLEVCVAAALLCNVRARGAAAIAAIMFIVFAAAMSQAVVRGINLDCGCFGADMAARVTWWSVLRNVALTACAVLVMLSGASSDEKKEDAAFEKLEPPAPQ